MKKFILSLLFATSSLLTMLPPLQPGRLPPLPRLSRSLPIQRTTDYVSIPIQSQSEIYENEKSKCSICFEKKLFMGKLPCKQGSKHPLICDKCFHEWNLKSDKCPYCRKKLLQYKVCPICHRRKENCNRKESYNRECDNLEYEEITCLSCLAALYNYCRNFLRKQYDLMEDDYGTL